MIIGCLMLRMLTVIFYYGSYEGFRIPYYALTSGVSFIFGEKYQVYLTFSKSLRCKGCFQMVDGTCEDTELFAD